ncbi:MAG: ABC-F family ATP-binding cassette domain-containing protein [Clostridium sp.]
MHVLSAEQIWKSYRETPLLKGVSFSLEQGDKVGVVGINGTGKSTLLKIVAGKEEPDQGNIVTASGVRIGYLPQTPDFQENRTVLQQVFAGASREYREEKAYEAKMILTKLGITNFDQPVTELSGGQKKRVAIAGALVTPCEVLILDEPTNHIDSEMVLWLEKYLARFNGALLMVTHDRYFLDRVTNRILEVDQGQLYSYAGNYSDFLEGKQQREEMAQSSERKRQAILRREWEWIHRGVKARGTKSKSRIQRYEELKEKKAPVTAQGMEMESIQSRLGKKTVEWIGVSKSYGEKVLIRDFNYLLQRRAHVGVIGPNGCGKSTLLKMIIGKVPPDQGKIVVGDTVKFGYFSQECEEMDPDQKVIDYIRDVAEVIQTPSGPVTAVQMLEKFLFTGSMAYTSIGRLSGGERRRLSLQRELMGAPNVLLLDEPTNDLDIQTLMILEEYLQGFEGAVIAVSHDRYFLDKVADHILEFRTDGEIRQYLGGYTDYFEESQVEARLKKTEGAPETKEKKGKPAAPKKLRFSYQEQREYQQIDGVIEALENRKQELEKEIIAASSDYTKLPELLEQKEKLEQDLEKKTERWVYLQDLAERIEAQKG